MELKVICKRLITPALDGAITEGEYGADIIGITVPRYHDEHDLSLFSFRMSAAAKNGQTAAVQVLTMDKTSEDSVHLLWTVTSEFTAVNGEVILMLTGVSEDNTVQIKYISQPVAINDDISLEFTESPTILEQTYNQVQLEAQKALDAAERAEAAAEEFKLNAAAEDELGGVKSGGDISVSEDGKVTVNSVCGKTLGKSVPSDAVFTDTVYTLPTASRTVLGGVVVDGKTITADKNGVISAVGSTGSSDGSEGSGGYTLLPATDRILGGVIVDGTTIVADEEGVISVADGALTIDSELSETSENAVQNKAVFSELAKKADTAEFAAHTADSSNPHGVTKEQIGLGNADNTADADKSVKYSELSGNADTVNGHTVNSDVPENAVFTDTLYTLPAASSEILGGVRPDGTTITTDENGIISALPQNSGLKFTVLLNESNKTVTNEYIPHTLSDSPNNYDLILISTAYDPNSSTDIEQYYSGSALFTPDYLSYITSANSRPRILLTANSTCFCYFDNTVSDMTTLYTYYCHHIIVIGINLT